MLAMIRYLQRLLFDPPEKPPDGETARARRVLSPEERERRRRARERLRRRQRVLFLFRLPKRPKRRRRSGGKRSTVPRPPRPDRVLKRTYKPLAHDLYNLPGGLVDEIKDFNLSDRYQLSRAHAILDRLAREWADEQCGTYAPEWLEDLPALHDALDRVAHNAPEVSAEDAILRDEWRQRAEEVQAGWTQNHEIKANNYWLPPMEYRPVKADGLELGGMRDVIE